MENMTAGRSVERRARRPRPSRRWENASKTVAMPHGSAGAPRAGARDVERDDPPVVEARRDTRAIDNDLLVVRCPFCDGEHLHGATGKGVPLGAGDGYRESHCRDRALRGTYDVCEVA